MSLSGVHFSDGPSHSSTPSGSLLRISEGNSEPSLENAAKGRCLPLLLLSTAPSRCWGPSLLLTWRPTCTNSRPLGSCGILSVAKDNCLTLSWSLKDYGDKAFFQLHSVALSFWSPHMRPQRLSSDSFLAMLLVFSPHLPHLAPRYMITPF